MIATAVDAMVTSAAAAQQAFADWSEHRVDALLGDIAAGIAEYANELAEASVVETGLGVVDDKATIIRLASQSAYRTLRGEPGTGLLRVDERSGVAEIAAPMGVILGLVPRTQPAAAFAFKVLIALKARNAVILSCHRDAQGVSDSTGALITSIMQSHAAPHDLVQWLRARTDRDAVYELMRHPGVAFILATGGSRMVRAAYSSGTPAIGVGPGNAPVWLCDDADLDPVARSVVGSKSFDAGVICGSENNLVVDSAVESDFAAALERHGAIVLRDHEVSAFVDFAFDAAEGLRHELHGQSAARIAEAAGLDRGRDARLIVVPAPLDQVSGPLGREKLAPVLSLFAVEGDDQALAISRQLLTNDGAGHTAIIHTFDEDRIARFAREMPVSRVLVNAPGAQGVLGLATGLATSVTLGTGTFGGTSSTDAITYTHLRNIKRVAYGRPLPAMG
jgi:acyl-CoA reductase-like NAD-dependent aldehyde dehydrogenase